MTALWANELLQGHLDVAEAINVNLVGRFRPGGIGASPSRPPVAAMDRLLPRPVLPRGQVMLQESNRLGLEFQLPGRSSMPNDTRATAFAHLSYTPSDRRGSRRRAAPPPTRASGSPRRRPFPVGPFTVCYLLGMRASVELAHEEFDEADRFATRQAEIAERHGFTFWTLISGLYRANVEFAAGDAAASQRASTMVMMLRATGLLVWVPSFLAAISAVHLARGEGAEAAALLEDAAEVGQPRPVRTTGRPRSLVSAARLRLWSATPRARPAPRGSGPQRRSDGAAPRALGPHFPLSPHRRPPARRAVNRAALAQLLWTIPLAADARAGVRPRRSWPTAT